jgi:hypothetical protein
VRHPASGSRTPVVINRYLLPREIEVATVRQHPAVLITPCAQAVAALVLGVIWTCALPHNLPQLIAIWSAVSLLVGHCVRRVVRWSVDYLVLTSERILVTSGFTFRSVRTYPLIALKDMTFERTWAGRLLGYGTFVNGPGRYPRIIEDFVPYPEQLYLLLASKLFPSAAYDFDDDESGPLALADEL